MAYTIDQVKQLVPEAKFFLGEIHFDTVNGMYWPVDEREPCFQLLLTTRRQLEIARAALGDIRDLWNDTQDAEIAKQALDAIEKEGE